MDCGTPHLLLDVRPKVEVDICHLPVSISMVSHGFHHFLKYWFYLVQFTPWKVLQNGISCWYMIPLRCFLLLIDIPLSSLEDKRTDHIHFLKEKIGNLKMQITSEIPGTWQKLHIYLRIYFYFLSLTHSSVFRFQMF